MGRVSFKTYYDSKCHLACLGSDLLKAVSDAKNHAGMSVVQLSNFALDQESLPEPDLIGVVAQFRKAGHPTYQSQAKMYFHPIRKMGIGIRRATQRIYTLVKSEMGTEVAQFVQRELVRRDAIHPIFYISVAFRPDLEIETYHDTQSCDRSHWAPGEIKNIAYALSGFASPAQQGFRIAQIAKEYDLQCHHISCDVLGGDQAVSIFFDHFGGEAHKEEACYAALRNICSLEGSLSSFSGAHAFDVDTRKPNMIGAKIECTPSAQFKAGLDLIDPEFKHFI